MMFNDTREGNDVFLPSGVTKLDWRVSIRESLFLAASLNTAFDVDGLLTGVRSLELKLSTKDHRISLIADFSNACMS